MRESHCCSSAGVPDPRPCSSKAPVTIRVVCTSHDTRQWIRWPEKARSGVRDRLAIVWQVQRCLAGQTLEHKDSDLQQYALSHGQPMELSQDRSNVLTALRTGYKSCGHVLDTPAYTALSIAVNIRSGRHHSQRRDVQVLNHCITFRVKAHNRTQWTTTLISCSTYMRKEQKATLNAYMIAVPVDVWRWWRPWRKFKVRVNKPLNNKHNSRLHATVSRYK